MVDWKWSVHSLPLGTLAIGRAERRAVESESVASNEDAVHFQEMDLLYRPPSWLSSDIIKFTRRARYDGYGSTGFTHTLMSQSHNSNPLLVEAINEGDIATLQHLFSKRLARPNDLITPKGRSLLQVS
jgi:hypothetical protein